MRRIWIFFLVLWSFFGVYGLWACFDLPHEWVKIDQTRPVGGAGMFGITDVLMKFREKFESRLAPLNLPGYTLNVAFVGWGPEKGRKASTAEGRLVQEACAVVWASGTCVLVPELLLDQDDLKEKASSLVSSSSFLVSVDILEKKTDQMTLIDLIFFQGVTLRNVFRESVSAVVKVMDRQGNFIFFETISVSPTVVCDVVLCPSTCLITHFEKRTTKPLNVDFGTIFPEIASAGWNGTGPCKHQ